MDYARGRYKRRKRGGLLTGRWLQEFRGQCPKNIEESKPKCRRCQLGLKATTRNLFPHSGLQAFRCKVPLISASFAAFAKVLHVCDAAEYIERVE